MKFVIAMMKHETNTFSPVPTPFESFVSHAAFSGDDAYQAFKGTNTPMAAFLDLAEKEGAEIITPIAAGTWPSGKVHAEAYQRITDAICDVITKGCDAVFLDLHGAMVSQSTDDGEGTLLERIRSIAPQIKYRDVLNYLNNLRYFSIQRLKEDERILGDTDFVQAMLSEAKEHFERYYELKRMGHD